MPDDFGLRIGIEGERDFRSALREINQSFKVLGSEMQLVTSQFDKNDNSIQAVTTRNVTLNKEIDAQKTKIEALKSALDNAAGVLEQWVFQPQCRSAPPFRWIPQARAPYR